MKRILKNKYGKKRDWREPYRESRRFDATCRCNGSCPYCKNNRLHSQIVKKLSAEEEIEEINEVDFNDN
jgi:MoaA/NifB/PqqE/SkfB family radical SAM enzyme